MLPILSFRTSAAALVWESVSFFHENPDCHGFLRSLAMTGQAFYSAPFLAYFFFTRKIIFGVSTLAFVFSSTEAVRNALPPMTEPAPITVSPPRMEALE